MLRERHLMPEYHAVGGALLIKLYNSLIYSSGQMKQSNHRRDCFANAIICFFTDLTGRKEGIMEPALVVRYSEFKWAWTIREKPRYCILPDKHNCTY